MCPMTASSGPPAVPFTRATVDPTLSGGTSAKPDAASRKNVAARRSSPQGPGAVSSLRRTSGTGMGAGQVSEVREPSGRALEQLPQHEGQDPAVLVVVDLLGRVDPHARGELRVPGPH